jgi:hypothetical protein
MTCELRCRYCDRSITYDLVWRHVTGLITCMLDDALRDPFVPGTYAEPYPDQVRLALARANDINGQARR